ncbi:MAG: hypothetical protein M1836_001647 [Candelina mexicana]|nr:MAG: hypothetical protein M1836_001647 [Candelina mexicana]
MARVLAPTQPGPEEALSGRRSASIRSSRSLRSNRSSETSRSTESTPLLSRDADQRHYNDEQPSGEATSPAASSLRSLQDGPQDKGTKARRWPTIIALTVLSIILALILVAGFFAPAIVQEYAMQATVFEPTNLSIDSFTVTGVRARVQGEFAMDASRVTNNVVRKIGRAATWIAREVESGESRVKVYLPEYGDVLLGMATIPHIVVNIRNGHVTSIDFLTDLQAGDIDGIRRIANEWLEGRLGQLRVEGRADVRLKSGLLRLGTQSISECIFFEGHDLPVMPAYNITKMSFYEVPLPDKQKAMAAEVSLTMSNPYPVKFTIPPLGFDILVANCAPDDPYILLADATTDVVDVEPREDISVDVGGIVHHLPDVLTTTCPDSQSSPLDMLLAEYIHGEETTVYIRGSSNPTPGTPAWVSDLASSITVPVPFPGHTFDGLIRNFSLADVHVGLPDPLAEPQTPGSKPKLSATVKALITLPREMGFPIVVSRVRADAEVSYHGAKLGNLDLSKWQKANSTRTQNKNNEAPELAVSSIVKNATLDVTDNDVFREVVQALVFGGKSIILSIKAEVDVEVETALGSLIIRNIPTRGKVPIKPLSGSSSGPFSPKVGSLEVVDTGLRTLSIQARVNFTNPTKYSTYVPYLNIHILNNNTVLGQALAKDVTIVPGPNDNIPVQALWDPSSSGLEGEHIGKELLSQAFARLKPQAGFNTTLTLKTHNGTIPSQPSLGNALSSLEIEIPTPKLSTPRKPSPGGDDDKGPKFIEDATVLLALLE